MVLTQTNAIHNVFYIWLLGSTCVIYLLSVKNIVYNISHIFLNLHGNNKLALVLYLIWHTTFYSSFVDGEPLHTLEEPIEKQEAVPVEGASVSEGDAEPPTEEIAAVEEVSPEESSQFTEESPSGDNDGYSAVEGAFLAAGFWVVWVMCSFWGTWPTIKWLERPHCRE